MDISYKRDLRKSYMCVTSQSKMAPFEKQLLSMHTIDGLLPLHVIKENDFEIYWYDITGKQAFDHLLDEGLMSGEMFLNFMGSLAGMVERLDNFLLKTDQLLLKKETIFYNRSDQTFSFGYYSESTEITDGLRELLEYILTKIDHTDKRAAEMIYKVYEQVMQEGFCLTKIRDSLNLSEEKICRKQVEEEMNIRELTDLNIPFTDSGKENPVQITTEDMNTKPASVKEKGIQGWKNIQWKKLLYKMVVHFFPDIDKLKKYREKKREKEEQPKIVFEPEKCEVQRGRPTILLNERVQEATGILRYEGNHGLRDLIIEDTPYTIGSASDCEGCVDCVTISRRHARITKTDGIYFIEDMNSANGTKVGGLELEYKTKVSIQPYEIIEFAGEKFRFI